jgi:hypothetical protein
MSGSVPRNGAQFCAVSLGSSAQFEQQQALGSLVHE